MARIIFGLMCAGAVVFCGMLMSSHIHQYPPLVISVLAAPFVFAGGVVFLHCFLS